MSLGFNRCGRLAPASAILALAKYSLSFPNRLQTFAITLHHAMRANSLRT